MSDVFIHANAERCCGRCGETKPLFDFRYAWVYSTRTTRKKLFVCQACADSIVGERLLRHETRVEAAQHGLKKCRGCKELKDLFDDFHVARGMNDGRNSLCKACVSIQRAARYKAEKAPFDPTRKRDDWT